MGNHMSSNHGRRGAWVVVHSLCPSETQKGKIWKPSSAELGAFPLAPTRPCRQGGRRNASQEDRVQLKCLHQWSPTRVVILFVGTCFLMGVSFLLFPSRTMTSHSFIQISGCLSFCHVSIMHYPLFPLECCGKACPLAPRTLHLSDQDEPLLNPFCLCEDTLRGSKT